MEDLVRLCEEELKMEEEEMRKLLPASATLYNCLLLSLNKDGIDREFWKCKGLLVCKDSMSEVGMDKIIVFRQPKPEIEDLKGKLESWLKTIRLQGKALVAAESNVSKLFQDILLQMGRAWEFEEQTHQYTQTSQKSVREDETKESIATKKFIGAFQVKVLCPDQVDIVVSQWKYCHPARFPAVRGMLLDLVAKKQDLGSFWQPFSSCFT